MHIYYSYVAVQVYLDPNSNLLAIPWANIWSYIMLIIMLLEDRP